MNDIEKSVKESMKIINKVGFEADKKYVMEMNKTKIEFKNSSDKFGIINKQLQKLESGEDLENLNQDLFNVFITPVEIVHEY